jgi:DNA-binding response OmpR family regulator
VILLVEDDEDVREMLAFTLRCWGYKVDVAKDGKAALAALERTRPCLMILDLYMPGMNGWKVMESSKLDGLPVCVITALEGPTPENAVATLYKPFEASALLAVAAQYCGHAAVPTPSGG